MDFAAACQEIATKLSSIDGLRTSWYPPDDINPPAAFPNGDGEVFFDETYGRGSDKIEFTLTLAVSRNFDRASWTNLLPYVTGSGAKSVKATLEGGNGTYTNIEYLWVTGVQFGQTEIAGIPYLAAGFSITLVGQGA